MLFWRENICSAGCRVRGACRFHRVSWTTCCLCSAWQHLHRPWHLPPRHSLSVGKSRSPEHKRRKKETCSWPLDTPLRALWGLRPGEKLLFPLLPWNKSVECPRGTSAGGSTPCPQLHTQALCMDSPLASTFVGVGLGVGGGNLVLKEARAEGASRARWLAHRRFHPSPWGSRS